MRRGLNCTLSYDAGAQTREYRVRCSRLVDAFQMIATESEARTERAFYPRQQAPTQFSLTVDLIGKKERDSFNAFLVRYAEYILSGEGMSAKKTPPMGVSLPSRGFRRFGIPVSGVDFSTRVGAFLYQPQIVFQTVGEPRDWGDDFYLSTALTVRAGTRSPETEFFYPSGTQLRGDQGPSQRRARRGPLTRQDAIQAALLGSEAILRGVASIDTMILGEEDN